MSSTARQTTRISARNYLLLALLGALVFLVGLRVAFAVEDKWGHDAFIRWDGLAGFTLLLFGLFVAESEKFLRKWRFWVVIVVLLMGHLAAFVIVLTHVEEWKLSWFMVMVFEAPLFFFLRDKFVSPLGGWRRSDNPK
jgi:peptidoglycan/LPS O-acetylase OafA/YrhL